MVEVILVGVRRVGICVVTTGGKALALTVDASQDRSSTNCETPLVTRLDNKSFVLMCMEQMLDQMSMATQLDIDRHNSMQPATDGSG